ncbi:hypothetical protein BDV98DRAFT_339932 [Pterulicium gracile]|uniref:Uncharacterized protein n=1 Tax=Pterulicium gracile TaxID=1884261 RepID=A0A5C3Q3N5_9AGAR|nr:hypothetical protein BDV98DRAFT_339932 [Pterula gracilis]
MRINRSAPIEETAVPSTSKLPSLSPDIASQRQFDVTCSCDGDFISRPAASLSFENSASVFKSTKPISEMDSEKLSRVRYLSVYTDRDEVTPSPLVIAVIVLAVVNLLLMITVVGLVWARRKQRRACRGSTIQPEDQCETASKIVTQTPSRKPVLAQWLRSLRLVPCKKRESVRSHLRASRTRTSSLSTLVNPGILEPYRKRYSRTLSLTGLPVVGIAARPTSHLSVKWAPPTSACSPSQSSVPSSPTPSSSACSPSQSLVSTLPTPSYPALSPSQSLVSTLPTPSSPAFSPSQSSDPSSPTPSNLRFPTCTSNRSYISLTESREDGPRSWALTVEDVASITEGINELRQMVPSIAERVTHLQEQMQECNPPPGYSSRRSSQTQMLPDVQTLPGL